MSESDSSLPPPLPAVPRRIRFRALVPLVAFPCLGGALGLVAGVIAGFAAPKKFESMAVVQVHHSILEADPLTGAAGARFQRADSNRSSIMTEIALIGQAQTLDRVIERLDLANRWKPMNRDAIEDALTTMISPEQIPGTDLIEIRVRHEKAQDARDVADAVAKAYQELRGEDERRRAEKALGVLDTELRNQEELVKEKRTAFFTIANKHGALPDAASGSGQIEHLAEQRRRAAQRQEYDREKEKQMLEIQIKTLLRLKNEELMKYAAGLNLPNNGVPEIYKQYEEGMRGVAALRASGLGENHPQIVTAKIAIEELERDLQEAVVVLQETLQTQLHLIDGQLERMREVVDEHRSDAVDNVRQLQDYVEAKQEYETAAGSLRDMKVQLGAKRLALKIPRSPVTIHERPALGRTPTRSDVKPFMLGGIQIGAAAGLLVAMLVSGRMILRRCLKHEGSAAGHS